MRRSNISLRNWFPGVFSISIFICGLREESLVQAVPSIGTIFRVAASRFQNQSLEQLPIDLRRGIGPDDAASIALYSNPALRGTRHRRGLAAAQPDQAGNLTSRI